MNCKSIMNVHNSNHFYVTINYFENTDVNMSIQYIAGYVSNAREDVIRVKDTTLSSLSGPQST